MAAGRHATARTSLAPTEATRAARPTTDKPPLSAVVRQASCQAFRAGREIDRAAAGMASGSTTPEGSSLSPFRLGGVNHPNM